MGKWDEVRRGGRGGRVRGGEGDDVGGGGVEDGEGQVDVGGGVQLGREGLGGRSVADGGGVGGVGVVADGGGAPPSVKEEGASPSVGGAGWAG